MLKAWKNWANLSAGVFRREKMLNGTYLLEALAISMKGTATLCGTRVMEHKFYKICLIV